MLDRTTGSSAQHLGVAAREGFAAQPSDPAVARTFQALLTAGYLVAAADELAPGERAALAGVLERAAGSAVDRTSFDRRLAEIDALRPHAAAELEKAAQVLSGPFARREAIVFATLVSFGDGTLAPEEVEALCELGRYLRLSKGDVYALIDDVVQSLTRVLA